MPANKTSYKPRMIRGRISGTETELDGQVLLLSQWDYDKHESYHLTGWGDEQDALVMQVMHQADETYSDMPEEEFAELWKSQDYDPPGAYCFELGQVEELEVVQEESKDA